MEFGRRNPGVFWTHNDSGWPAELYAVRPDGTIAARVKVRGAENVDWEDLAFGPCPGGGDCLYIGDIGDNHPDREEIAVWRVPEPSLHDPETAPAERLSAVYPDGPRDAEALFVLPDGRVYLITKGRDAAVELYHWPEARGAGPVVLERVRTLGAEPEQPGDLVTGAAASADGRRVAVRTYSTLSIYRAEDLLEGGAPEMVVDLVALEEPQGEAVAFGPDDTILLTSEGRDGVDPTANVLRCTFP